MAFSDLAEHLADTFGLSESMHYRLAVACVASHERALARAAAHNAERTRRYRTDPVYRDRIRAQHSARAATRTDAQRDHDRNRNTAYVRARKARDPAFAARVRATNTAYMRKKRLASAADRTSDIDALRALLAAARSLCARRVTVCEQHTGRQKRDE